MKTECRKGEDGTARKGEKKGGNPTAKTSSVRNTSTGRTSLARRNASTVRTISVRHTSTVRESSSNK